MYGGGRKVSGAWNEHTHTTIHKTDNQGIPWLSSGKDLVLSFLWAPGSIPGHGTKIPHAACPPKKIDNQQGPVGILLNTRKEYKKE